MISQSQRVVDHGSTAMRFQGNINKSDIFSCVHSLHLHNNSQPKQLFKRNISDRYSFIKQHLYFLLCDTVIDISSSFSYQVSFQGETS